jgi:hypothetical protein
MLKVEGAKPGSHRPLTGKSAISRYDITTYEKWYSQREGMIAGNECDVDNIIDD